MRIAAIALVATLAGCAGTETIYRDRPVEVLTPVSQPCATARPAEVQPLKSRIPEGLWYGEMDVSQKSAAVGRQGLARQEYGEQLNAATGACPDVESGEGGLAGESLPRRSISSR